MLCIFCDKDAFLPWPDVDMDGSSPKVKSQAHKQGACSDTQMETDTLHSLSELQLVQDKIINSFIDWAGHEKKTLEMDHRKHFTTQNMDILLECTRNKKQRPTWKATAEEIPAESRN